MVQDKPGYCRCGYEIWVEYLWTGETWTYRFYDANHQEIDKCPVCGKTLHEDDLESI